mmetsp:Transcript_78660/g.163559  ORF Transcript_78660/g.163559 Transcript_78660/m.163559 type:complete len:206 (+) Transcript_78660:699-1316(+)
MAFVLMASPSEAGIQSSLYFRGDKPRGHRACRGTRHHRRGRAHVASGPCDALKPLVDHVDHLLSHGFLLLVSLPHRLRLLLPSLAQLVCWNSQLSCQSSSFATTPFVELVEGLAEGVFVLPERRSAQSQSAEADEAGQGPHAGFLSLGGIFALELPDGLLQELPEQREARGDEVAPNYPGGARDQSDEQGQGTPAALWKPARRLC